MKRLRSLRAEKGRGGVATCGRIAAALEFHSPMPIRREIAALGLEDHEEVRARFGITCAYGWFVRRRPQKLRTDRP